MLLSELHYDLPPELIAQKPADPRDSARLMVLDRQAGGLEHRVFRDLGSYLRPGDCLVLNDTRVIPARFLCRRASGARVEGLLLAEEGGLWRVLLKPSGRLRVGEELHCESAGGLRFRVTERLDRGEWLVEPTLPTPALELLAQIGQVPLPPYIRARRREMAKPEATARDADDYQTVYAERPGAVAAPTAGLHFTPHLLDSLAAAGAEIAKVTLHVGPGTFAPVEVEDLAEHRMHAEQYEVRADQLELIRAAQQSGGRIVAVGTTTCRALESAARTPAWRSTPASDICGWTDLLISPPFAFGATDALVTNFHLPGSTLLALVMAFAGVEPVRRAYATAVAEGYRFYSYGDAMLIV